MVVEKSMTVAEFAKFAHCSEWVVRRKCKSGEIPAMKAGKQWTVFAQEYVDRQLGTKE